MNEAQLTLKIRKRLKAEYGGVWKKIHGSRFQSAGLPDIVGCLKGQFYAIEVKMPGKELTPLQRLTLQEFEDEGAITGVAFSVEDALEIVKEGRRQVYIDSETVRI